MERREFLKKSTIAATAMILPVAARSQDAPTWSPYHKMTVIDALGAPGSSGFGDRVPLTAADIADIKASGVTAVNVTVGGVGSYTKDFEETLRNIAFWEEQTVAHPDVLLKIKSAADLIEAKKKQSARTHLRFSGCDAARRIVGTTRSLLRSRCSHHSIHLQSAQSRR
jgi:membrane dipeptidase